MLTAWLLLLFNRDHCLVTALLENTALISTKTQHVMVLLVTSSKTSMMLCFGASFGDGLC